jgi:hypothetical protein
MRYAVGCKASFLNFDSIKRSKFVNRANFSFIYVVLNPALFAILFIVCKNRVYYRSDHFGAISSNGSRSLI